MWDSNMMRNGKKKILIPWVLVIVFLSYSFSDSALSSDKSKIARISSFLSISSNPNEPSAEAWSSLLQRKPYPHNSPLPPEESTALDGTYTKIDPKQQPPVPCRRCPDYVPEGGIWKLQFDKGVFRIFHVDSGWKSIGSYKVENNLLSLFNDPVCPEITGVYKWILENNQLVLQEVMDKCNIRLRSKNLIKQPWLSCNPPNTEAAITGHWNVPPGCQ